VFRIVSAASLRDAAKTTRLFTRNLIRRELQIGTN